MSGQSTAGIAAGRAAVVMADRHLGNFLVATPVLGALGRAAGPHERLFLIDRRFAELVRRAPGLPPFTTLERGSGSRARDLRAFASTLAALRRFAPEITLDLQANNTGAWLTFLSGARLRISETAKRRDWAYTRRIEVPAAAHRLRQYATLAAQIDPDIAVTEYPQLSPLSEDRAALDALWLEDGSRPERPLACLHVGGGRPHKRWPPERFIELAGVLHGRGFEPVFIGGPAEAALLEAASPPRVPHRNLVGRTPLGTLLALLQRASLFVGNDSGPMHLAAAAGCPVAAIFGPNCARQWAPLTTARAIIHSDRLTLGDEEPPAQAGGAEIQQVPPGLVLQGIEYVLANRRGKS